jgi:excisionase family DNA binding protein
MVTHLSTRELADALGVSESSIKRWVDAGELAAVRTAGGHRRIARSEAIRFSRANSLLPKKPELLSIFQMRIEDSALDGPRRVAAFHRALLDDDRARAFGLLMSAYLAGESIASLCDGPIRLALEQLGELWKHDERGILSEHRATDMCLHAVAALRAALPPAADAAPVALGSAGSADPYLLPSLMCAAVLAEAGFRDVNLGPLTPVATKLAAVERYRPLLVWHTASVGDDDVRELAQAITPPVRLVVGGRGLGPQPLPPTVVSLGSMTELQAFARELAPAL